MLVELDRSRPRGLRAQIEDELRDAIRSGRLAAGTALPSSRALAADLGVTRGVVVAAYDQLCAEGYLASRPGAGTVVNAAAVGESDGGRTAVTADEVVVDFRTALPDLSLFPRAAWMRATRAAYSRMTDESLGYIDPRGLPELRATVADYLGRVRGVIADSERVVICNGYGHGLALVARAMTDAGIDRFGVEDPGHDGPRAELAWMGIDCRGIAVDRDGLVVDELRRSSARAVVVTPAHHYPTGALLTPARRHDLVTWARDVDGYVIEDDYDAEYRYDRQPVGALQGLAPDHVVYCGTLSKSLSPGLRLGWMVLPAELVDPIVAMRRLTDHAAPSHMQAACAEFLAHGDLDRHLRRTRRIYRQRRDALVDALRRWLPDATVGGIAAGLHVLVTLPDGLDEDAVVARAAEGGVRAYPLGQYRTSRQPGAAPAIVLGYGNLSTDAIEHGVRQLASAIDRRGGQRVAG